jgi:hypothetical protein
MIKAKVKADNRIFQGDVIRDVDCIETVTEYEGIIEVSKITFPLIVVLTQDCDLEQDHLLQFQPKDSQDKRLISVLVAPLYNAEHVFRGEHLSELGINSQFIRKGRTPGDFLITNQNPRYHYIEFPKELNIVPSVIDFKHYFSVHVSYLQELRKGNFICTVSELYREDISQRFASFLSRIGLPNE